MHTFPDICASQKRDFGCYNSTGAKWNYTHSADFKLTCVPKPKKPKKPKKVKQPKKVKKPMGMR